MTDGVDRQARHQPIGVAAAGDRRHLEAQTAKGPDPLGGFHRDAVLAAEAVGNDGHRAGSWETHARTVVVDGVVGDLPAAMASHRLPCDRGRQALERGGAKQGVDHRHHRSRRFVPGGMAVVARLRSSRDGPALEHSQLRADRAHSRPVDSCVRRRPRRGLDDRGPARASSQRGLQPRCSVVRADVLGPARAHRRGYGARRDPRSRRDPVDQSRDPLLPGELLGNVRQGSERFPRPRTRPFTRAAPMASRRSMGTGSP